MPRIRPEVGDELAGLICAGVQDLCGVEVERCSSRRWASITFSGQRHELSLRLEGRQAGAAADALVRELSERDFALRGHIVADIAVASQERRPDGGLVRLDLEALTVEAA